MRRVRPRSSPLDGPLRIMLADGGAHIHAEAVFRSAAVLSHAHLQGGEEEASLGRGTGYVASRARRMRETAPLSAAVSEVTVMVTSWVGWVSSTTV